MEAEKRKAGKYRNLEGKFFFLPIGIETLGAWGPQAKNLISTIEQKLISATGDARAASFLAQRISMAIQRGNAASIMASLPRGRQLSELWNL